MGNFLRVLGALSYLLLACLMAASVLAHGEGDGWLLIPENNVAPGEPFTLYGDDMDPDADVIVEISSFGEVYPLGVVRSDPEGHFQAHVRVPQEMREGYALVEATTTSGTVASTWLAVDDTSQAVVPGGGAPGEQAPFWADPSVLILGIFLGGAGAALLYLLFRPSAKRQAPSAARARSAATVSPPRVVPRKSKTKQKPRRA